MSIIIRKKATGEVFDVVPDFKLEMRNTSPIFNELGSKTITTSLPKTPNNNRLLGFSHRLDITNKPDLKIPVIVSSGSYIRNGMLYESSAYNTDKTFGITIAFDEGIMYEAMSDILLTELSDLPVIESTEDGLYQMMNTLFTTDDPDEKLSVFQIYFKKQTYQETENGEEVEKAFYEYANGVTTLSAGTAKLKERESTYAIEDNSLVEISVPAGYGITPFVRVWYLLELVFGHFGYQVGTNPFKEDFQLKRLCVLNNTIDAIVTGTLDYKQLLPPVSINDFLNALYCRFGMKVSFDSNTNTVNLFLLREVFSSDKVSSLPLADWPDIDYTAAKQIKLSVAKNLDQSETETETYEEFLAKYNNTVGSISDTLVTVKAGGIYQDQRAGLFYQCSTVNNEKKLLSSIHFDWNKKDEGLEAEEISSIDEALTFRHDEDASYAFLYFGLTQQLMNSVLSINGTSQKTDTANVLAFAFDMGYAWIPLDNNGSTLRLGYKYGSIFPYAWQSDSVLQKDTDGNEFRYSLTLTGEYGAFNRFFKEYDAFLRHSNHTVKIQSFQFAYNLSNINFTRKQIVLNQPLMLDKVDHDLDGHWGQNCEIEARTLRLYKPYDLDREQALPVPENIKYQWVQYANRDLNIEHRYGEIVTEKTAYQTANPLTYKFVSLGAGEVVSDPNPPGDTTYWFLPPTEYQFLNGLRTGSRTHTCTVRYLYKYQSRTSIGIDSEWIDYTEYITEELPYSSWFEAEVIE